MLLPTRSMTYTFLPTGKGCKPKYLGLGVMTMGLGALLFSVPHFATGPYLPNQHSNDDSSLCDVINSSFVLNSSSSSASSSSSSPSPSPSCDVGVSRYLALFVVAQLLHGAGACPMWILGVTYMDDNLSREESSFYIGIYYSFAILGPAIG